MAYTEEGISTAKFVCGDNKPNVFLIGDSIKRGYCATVKDRLASFANVFYVDDNCRNTQYVITEMTGWSRNFSDTAKVDIVHFNCGHWDIAHWRGNGPSLTGKEEYGKNIRLIIDDLRALFVNAEIIFATTTPMNPTGLVGMNPRSNGEIDEYNRIAVRVCNENDVPVNDLNGFCRDWESDLYKDYCHFTAEGFTRLGEEVAKYIKDRLQGR